MLKETSEGSATETPIRRTDSDRRTGPIWSAALSSAEAEFARLTLDGAVEDDDIPFDRLFGLDH